MAKTKSVCLFIIVIFCAFSKACPSSPNRLDSTTKDLRIIRVQMGNQNGDGMDGGTFGNQNWGGGRFSFKLCFQDENRCCETGKLKTEDNNWEKGQVNYFVGFQMGDCADFNLDGEGSLSVKVQHAGNDGGRIKDIILWSSHQKLGLSYKCEIQEKLDHDESTTATCANTRAEPDSNLGETCNGNAKFCQIKFNEFMFPGTHNSGTGLLRTVSLLDCHTKNQDLNITEMLDFGIRFFDFDTKYTSNGKLETGHGPVDSLWIRYGKVSDALIEIKDWMNKHPEEIVVIYFGNKLGNVTEGHKELRAMLENEFNGLDGNVGLNNYWQNNNQEWPTLQMAKDSNQRAFAIVRTKTEEEAKLFSGSKVLPEKQYKLDEPALDLGSGNFINVLSTYQNINIGSKCKSIVDSIGKSCQVHPEAKFVKLAIFGTHAWLKNSPTKCLSTLVRKCNQQVKNSINVCRSSGRGNINFLQVDYPNHPGPGLKTVVEIAHEENKKHGIAVKELGLSGGTGPTASEKHITFAICMVLWLLQQYSND